MTDGGVALKGWEITDVAIENIVLPESAFASDGWIRVDGEWQQKTDRYYIAEYRTYDGFDESLKDCYQWNDGYASWVDWFSYNRGLHLIYRDTFYEDNDVATHIGAGGWMVVDAHPKVDSVAYSDGATDYVGYWRPRIQVRDAAFSLKPTRTQSIYFIDYDEGWGVAESTAPGKARAAAVQRREDVLVRRRPRGRGEDPEGPRRAHQRQVDGLRQHDHLGRQREVTRRLTRPT